MLNTIHTHNRLVALRKPILVLRALGTNFLEIRKTNIFQCSSKTELNELCFAFFLATSKKIRIFANEITTKNTTYRNKIIEDK